MRKNTRLKKARAGQGFTQRQLAEAIDMPYMTYVQKENGVYDFRELEIETICKVLNKKVTDIFFAK